ncbi:DUF747-domain-containing protein [Piromyces finnis]|uniref:DUF747-domain-containing protein n=1 Tax=Piromyces finnis TaxID=1754191 RepID=A0A1Y1V4M8_9FUNG|nr:DUF747-domain-containing protein [Piromyces finnis]|eukprot:ORX45808.1 DUF747-domain-containing protein [Piromyces finnis]
MEGNENQVNNNLVNTNDIVNNEKQILNRKDNNNDVDGKLQKNKSDNNSNSEDKLGKTILNENLIAEKKVIILKMDEEGNLKKENNDNEDTPKAIEDIPQDEVNFKNTLRKSRERITIIDKPIYINDDTSDIDIKNEKSNRKDYHKNIDKDKLNSNASTYDPLMDIITPDTTEDISHYNTSEKTNNDFNENEPHDDIKRRGTYAVSPDQTVEDSSEPYLIRSNSLPNLLPSQIYTSFSSEQSSNANTPIISSHDLLSEVKINQDSLNDSFTRISSSEASLSTIPNNEIEIIKKKYYHEKSKLSKMDSIENQKVSIIDATSVDDSATSPRMSINTEKDVKKKEEEIKKEEEEEEVEIPIFYRNPLIFLKSEIFGEDAIPEKLSELKKERIQNFLAVPVELEKFLNYGILICLDSFLYTFTILPIRLVVATYSMIKGLFVKNAFKTRHKSDILKGLLMLFCCIALQYIDVSRLYHFVRGQNIVKLYLIYNLMENFDKLCSAFGHDVLDSLFAENIIKKSNKGSRFPVIVHFVVALIYLILHTVVLFYLVVSLNVAINSYNNALLSFLISNQFGEIKSAVFKRFERENLFQLTCADIVERFQILNFLVIITGRNFIELTGTGAETLSHFYTLFSKSILSPASVSSIIPKLDILHTFQTSNFPELFEKIVNLIVSWFTDFLNSPTYQLLAVLLTPVVVIYGSEMFVDYLKHTFITKFNQIKPSVYDKYRDSLCKDFAGTKKYSDNQILDRSSYVSRRIGFITLPLACLTIRIMMQTLKMFGYLYIDGDSLHSFSIHNFFMEDGSLNIHYIKRFSINIFIIFTFLCFIYISALFFKLYLSLYIHKISYKRVQEMKKETENKAALESKRAESKRMVEDGPVDYHQYQRQPNDIPPQNDDKLDKIDRYMMVKSRIP